MLAQIFDQTTPYVSGYSMRSRYITESLTKWGVNIKVYSSPIFEYKNATENINGAAYIRAPFLSSPFLRRLPGVKELSVVNRLSQTINDHWDGEIKILSAHSSVLNGIAGWRAAKKHNVPFLYEIRALWEDAAVDQGKTRQGSPRYNLTRAIETDTIKKADKITVICRGLKDDIIKRGIPEEKITIIPNGVDVESFKKQPPDEELIKKYSLSGCKVLGFVGTFFEFEGLELLIKAMHQIAQQKRDVKLLLVGGGRVEEKLKAMVTGLQLDDQVIFSGRVKHAEVNRYYSVIDVLVYLRISKRITELVTPLKPLEAMALEKIVIGSDVGGIKELVTDGYNGILFKAQSVDDLSE